MQSLRLSVEWLAAAGQTAEKLLASLCVPVADRSGDDSMQVYIDVVVGVFGDAVAYGLFALQASFVF